MNSLSPHQLKPKANEQQRDGMKGEQAKAGNLIITYEYQLAVQCHLIAPSKLAPSSFAPSKCWAKHRMATKVVSYSQLHGLEINENMVK